MVLDIYVDINGQPNAGTASFLSHRGYATSPTDAWEYAISMKGPMATLFRTQGTGSYGIIQTFPLVVEGNRYRVNIPRDLMRGNPERWGYQVLAMATSPQDPGLPILSDFIDPLEISQQDLWAVLSSGKRSDIPFLHIRPR